MQLLRLVGFTPRILKVRHTRYLMDGLGFHLADAKKITDDVLGGEVREIPVHANHAQLHATALRNLGVIVEVVGGSNDDVNKSA